MGGPLPSSPGDLKGREGKRPAGPGVPRNRSPGDVRGDGEGDTGGGTGGLRRSRRAPRTPAGSPRAPVGSPGGPQGSRRPGAPGPRGLLGPSRPHGSRDTSRGGLGCRGVRGHFLHAPGGPPGLLGPLGTGGGDGEQLVFTMFLNQRKHMLQNLCNMSCATTSCDFEQFGCHDVPLYYLAYLYD